ncbi:MAG: hypothetical protein WCC64_03150, partial [Aliidongia sp.]
MIQTLGNQQRAILAGQYTAEDLVKYYANLGTKAGPTISRKVNPHEFTLHIAKARIGLTGIYAGQLVAKPH